MSDDPDFARQPAPPLALAGVVGRGKASYDLAGGSAETGADRPETSPPLEEYFCGIRRWRPRWLQVFRNEKFFTVILCCNCFIQAALVSGFTSVVLSTIEKRYRFPSTTAGLIASSYDVAVLISVLFISYFGGKGHKPRWLGVSLIVMGIGAYVFALPQFVLGSYDVGRDAELTFEACADGEDFSPDCSGADGLAIAFFVVGQLLIGVGAAPLYTVGTAYLDEIVHPKRVAVHLGFFYALTVFGPSLGYGLGGAFLTVYVDPWHSTTLEPSDPGWVGAWWICFLFAGTVSILLSTPFFLFPRLLPDSHLVKQARQEEMAKVYHSKYGDKEDTDFATGVKSFPTHIKSVCTNPSWLLITLAITSAIVILAGLASFAPKFIESQFHLTASNASVVAGAIGITSGGLGVIVGALIIHFSKTKGRRLVLFNWVVSLITVGGAFVFLVHCPTLNLVGVKEPYPDGSENSDLDSSCTVPCNCTSTVFEPVCGTDGFTYFSPCRAGCQKIPGTETFENCTCIAQRQIGNMGLNISSPSLVEAFQSNSTASDGQCDENCDSLLAVFAVFAGVLLFLAFMIQVPDVIITVRCVAEQQRTLALGLQSVVWRTFASIPGPVVFGAIFDSTCLQWQYECGRRGNCWVYENTHLSQRALALALIGNFLNFVFTFLCWLVYPRRNEGKGEEEPSSEGKGGSESGRHMSKDILLQPVQSNSSFSDPLGVTKEQEVAEVDNNELRGAW